MNPKPQCSELMVKSWFCNVKTGRELFPLFWNCPGH